MPSGISISTSRSVRSCAPIAASTSRSARRTRIATSSTRCCAQWRATLAKTLALRPDHISSYCLTYEEDTAYFQKLAHGDFRQDEERDAQLFEETMDTLTAGGFAQYEISNYAHRDPGSREIRES